MDFCPGLKGLYLGLSPSVKSTDPGACLKRKCLLIPGEDAVQVGEQRGDALLAVHYVQPPVCLLVHPHLRACEGSLHGALARQHGSGTRSVGGVLRSDPTTAGGGRETSGLAALLVACWPEDAYLWDWESQEDGLHKTRACCDVPYKAPLVLWLEIQQSPLLLRTCSPGLELKAPEQRRIQMPFAGKTG